MASRPCRSVAATTSRRISACRERIVGRKDSGSGIRPAVEAVMDIRDRKQFCGLRFGSCVAEKVAAPDLGTRQVLQQLGFSQRRVTLDVEVKAAVIAAVRRRLV